MELISISFVIVVVKLTICVVTPIIGFYLIFSSRHRKREMRRWLKHSIYEGFGDLSTKRFAVWVIIIGFLLIVFSGYSWWRFFIGDIFA